MSKKNDRDYWYDYLDINYLLKAKRQGNVYAVIDSTGADDLQTLQRVNEAFTVLNNQNSLNVVVIPINLGIGNGGIWQGLHWVGLVIKKIGSTFKVFYTNSFGTPMEASFATSDGATFCALKQILINHGVTENNIIESNINLPVAQQSNGYDCGPWTVFNLDSLARTEELPNVCDQEILAQRNSLLPDPLELLPEEYSDGELSKNLASRTEEDIIGCMKKQLSFTPLPSTNFVISTIAYVPEHEFSNDSSSEEMDGTFSDADFNFDPKNKSSFPFTTTAPKRKGRKKKIGSLELSRQSANAQENVAMFWHHHNKKKLRLFAEKLPCGEIVNGIIPKSSESSFSFSTTAPKGNVKKRKVSKDIHEDFNEDICEDINELSNPNQSDSISTIITPFLEKLSQNGFEEYDKDKLTTSISVSIGLNRMKSLSTRKNKSLDLELKCKMKKTDIRYEKFGFFWKCKWYYQEGTSVHQSRLRRFYKQLKKLDPKKAEEFREMEEKNFDVPYQALREHAKNHIKTKKLVQEFRKKHHNANIYLSLIDIDTINFNGIYSAYLRVVKECKIFFNIPTVMSTGYEYSENEPAYQFASEIDRMIRVITALYIPHGVYYPEPNTCILIEQGCDTLLESFTDKNRKKGNLESACLLKNIQNRKNALFIFSPDKPLITTIPDRAKLNKASKSPISFSFEFRQGASPTEDDIKSCKQVAQSCFHEKVWYDNLFINGAIVVNKDKPRATQQCKHLLAKIRNPKDANEKDEAINELKQYIKNSDVVDAINKAAKAVEKFVKQTKIEYIRSENEEELLRILKERKIEIAKFSRDEILMLAQQPVLELVKEEVISIQDLRELDTEILKYICYDGEIMEMVKNKTIDFDNLLYLLKENFSDFMEARREYSILDILDKYAENPHHLTFMAGDPDDIVYVNSDNVGLVIFGIKNYDVDMDWIRSELDMGPDREASAALLDFDRIIGRD